MKVGDCWACGNRGRNLFPDPIGVWVEENDPDWIPGADPMAVCAECRERRALLVEFYDRTPSGFRIAWTPDFYKDMDVDSSYQPKFRENLETWLEAAA